jgi:protein-S-isoprenylcysteine O-methyltransferase Ste14
MTLRDLLDSGGYTGFDEKYALPDHPFLVLGIAALLALIFIPAGTLQYWQGWAYIVIAIVASGAYTLYLARHDPALLKRRTEAGISYEREPAQKIIVFLLFVVCTALVVVSPLDFRFGWSSVPWYVSVIGDALVAFSFYIFYLVSKVNTYAAANVRVEEGQQVVSTGMYALVRHPMYLALQLHFSLEVSTARLGLVSASPE